MCVGFWVFHVPSLIHIQLYVCVYVQTVGIAWKGSALETFANLTWEAAAQVR